MEIVKMHEWDKYAKVSAAHILISYEGSKEYDIYTPGEVEKYVEALEAKRKANVIKRSLKNLVTVASATNEYEYVIDTTKEYQDVQFKDGMVFLQDTISLASAGNLFHFHNININKLILPRTFRESIDGALKHVRANHIVIPIEARINVDEWQVFFTSITEPKKFGENQPMKDPNEKSITFTYLSDDLIMSKLKSLMKAKEKYGNPDYVRERLTIKFDGPLMSEEIKQEITSFLKQNGVVKVEFKNEKLAISNRNMIKELLEKSTYVSPEVREVILNQIDTITNNYYEVMKSQKPTINFNSELNPNNNELTPAEIELNNDLIRLVHRVNNELDDLKKIALYRKYLFKENEHECKHRFNEGYANVAQLIENIKEYVILKHGYGNEYNIAANYINNLLMEVEKGKEEYIKTGEKPILGDILEPHYLFNKLSDYYKLVVQGKFLEQEVNQNNIINFNQEYENKENEEHHIIDEIDEKIHELITELDKDIPDLDYRTKVREVLESINTLEQKEEFTNIINCLKLIDNDLENDLTVEQTDETLAIQEIINVINANNLNNKDREQIYSYIGQILENAANGVEMDLLAELENAKFITRSYIIERNKFKEQVEEFEQNYNNANISEYELQDGPTALLMSEERIVLEQHNEGHVIRRR